MTTTGERLRLLREVAGISLRELDRLAGLCPGHSWLIETGKSPNPEVKTLCAQAVTLGSTVGYLAAGEGFGPTRDRVLSAIEAARVRLAAQAEAIEAEAPEPPIATSETPEDGDHV